MKPILASLLLLCTVASGTAVGESRHAALALVEQTSERMLVALRENRSVLDANSEHIYSLVDQILLPHFDFAAMSRWVLGKSWRTATTDQRERFTTEFRTFLVRAYAKALLAYSDEQIRYLAATPGNYQRVTVRTEVHSPGRPAVPVNYTMRRGRGSDWKVSDIKVDGISLVTNYRKSFASQVREHGMDGLISRLRERNLHDGS